MPPGPINALVTHPCPGRHQRGAASAKTPAEVVSINDLLQRCFLSDPATHNELACDEAARLLFGAPIYYDEEDVQTTDPTGTTPRPSYLPE